MECMQFDYCNTSVEHFSFYKLPTYLLDSDRFKGLSLEAAVLYGLFLDRVSLSVKNNWLDEQGRVYIIFPVKEIEQKLRCKHDKAIKVLSELDTVNGIGLVEKKKQGLGRPDMLFIKNFLTGADNTEINIPSIQQTAETVKTEFKKSEKPTPEVGKTDPINNNIIKNDIKQTEIIQYQLNRKESQGKQSKADDPIDDKHLIDGLKLKWDYDALSDRYGSEVTDNVFNAINSVIQNPKMRFKSYTHEMLKDFILKREKSEIEYFLGCLLKSDKQIEAFIPYLLNSLINNRNNYGFSSFKCSRKIKPHDGFYFSGQRESKNYDELEEEARNFCLEKGERLKKRMRGFNCSEDDINRMYEALLKEGIQKAREIEDEVYKRMQLNIVWNYGEPELVEAV